MELHDGDRNHLCATADRDLLHIPSQNERRSNTGRRQGLSLTTATPASRRPRFSPGGSPPRASHGGWPRDGHAIETDAPVEFAPWSGSLHRGAPPDVTEEPPCGVASSQRKLAPDWRLWLASALFHVVLLASI